LLGFEILLIKPKYFVFSLEPEQQMSRIEPGGHLCLFYDKDPAEQMPVLIPFIREGLLREEQFIYIADDQTAEELVARLQDGGIDVGSKCDSGRLKLWTRDDRRQLGELDSAEKARQMREFVSQAARSGFKGVRFAIEMTWTLGSNSDARKLEAWEATSNTLLEPSFPCRVICQYNRSRLQPETLIAALHAHPHVILGRTVYPNPFFEAPLNSSVNGRTSACVHEIGNRDEDAARAKLDWMLARLQQLGEDVEKHVQERTASLRESVAQLEEFSFSVSHDLRGPVRAMKGYAEMALEEYGDCLDARGREFIERIVSGSSRMERLIHDVLTYSRLAQCEIKLQRTSFRKLLQELFRERPEIQPPNAEITVREPLHDVLAHERSLTQAVSNLLTNGVKFVARGTVPRLQIWTERRDGKVRLWVEDNGIGIKPEAQGRLFSMFERVHQDGGYDGTGLGLAIVRKAAERMGGCVGMESDGVSGSSFWIELKAADQG
jgi:signal transduction histidine kinase